MKLWMKDSIKITLTDFNKVTADPGIPETADKIK